MAASVLSSAGRSIASVLSESRTWLSVSTEEQVTGHVLPWVLSQRYGPCAGRPQSGGPEGVTHLRVTGAPAARPALPPPDHGLLALVAGQPLQFLVWIVIVLEPGEHRDEDDRHEAEGRHSPHQPNRDLLIGDRAQPVAGGVVAVEHGVVGEPERIGDGPG